MNERTKSLDPDRKGTRWIAQSGETYMLLADGEVLAVANITDNTEVMVKDRQSYSVFPHSISVVASIEKKLGLGEVPELRLADGARAPEGWRDRLEERALEIRRKHTPESEALLYVRKAVEGIAALEKKRSLQGEERGLPTNTRQALDALDRNQANAISNALAALSEVQRADRLIPHTPSDLWPILRDCERACRCLEALQRDPGRRDPDRSAGRSDLPNHIAYIESRHGPEQEYCCTAYITRHPTPQGLDGGHLLEFSIARENPRWRSHIPDRDDPGYETWIRNNPRETPIAGYKDGALARYAPDAGLDAVIEQIKEAYSSEKMKALSDQLQWHDHEPQSRDASRDHSAKETGTFAHSLKKAALQEAERGQEKMRDQDKDSERSR